LHGARRTSRSAWARFRGVLRIPRRAAATAAMVACALLAGCGGSGDDYANKPRPATPINVTAAISTKKISLSPKTFKAGPTVFVISNQSGTPQVVTLQTEELGGSQPGLKASTDPVAPGGTANLKVDVREGTYELSVKKGPPPVTVEVKGKRKSAQDELLQP
jgi:hypothetical protein